MKKSENIDLIVKRFYNKVEVQEHGCWYWQGHISKPHEYGNFSFGYQQTGAHRASYMLHIGDIPEGYEIDHLCKIPYCVNPDHLEAVTQAENSRRSAIGKSWELHLLKKCSKGHDVQGENAKPHRKANGRVKYRCRICARAYKKQYREAL